MRGWAGRHEVSMETAWDPHGEGVLGWANRMRMRAGREQCL